MKEIYINADDYNSDSIRTIQGNNNAEEYKIYLQYDNEKIDLTNKTVNLAFLKVGSTDGDIIENLNITDPVNGEITLKITNKLTRKNGTYSCQLAILGEGDFLEHTATFTLTVENNIFSDITKAIADSKDFTYLERILEEAKTVSGDLKTNIPVAFNLNTSLESNINNANTVNQTLMATTEQSKVAATEATQKKSELESSLEETKKFIEGLDGSQNIPQIRMELTELQNGLKSNQALAYKGSSINAENTLEGRTEGMKIGGRTLQNLIKNESYDLKSFPITLENNYFTFTTDGNFQFRNIISNEKNLIPSTEYTIIYEVKENTLSEGNYVEACNTTNFNSSVVIDSVTKPGIYSKRVLTKSQLDEAGHALYFNASTNNALGQILKLRVMLLKGNLTDIPNYFEGIKSFGEAEGNKISILSNSKNLCDVRKAYTDYTGFSFVTDNNNNKLSITGTTNNQWAYVGIPVELRPNIDLTFSFKGSGNNNFLKANIILESNKNNSLTGDISANSSKTFRVNERCTAIIKLFFSGATTGNFNVDYWDIQLEEGTQATPYEPYKSDKKDILIKEPLREGDYLYEDNEQVKVDRESGQYTITSNERITKENTLINITRFYIDTQCKNKVNTRNIICNNFNSSGTWWDRDEIGMYWDTSIQGRLWFHIPKTKFNDVESFRNFLKANPTTIVYQLATPVTEVVENCVDIDLDTFQDKTYFSIENSLPGTLDFKVPSNIGSVVQNMAKEVNNIWDVINNLLVPGILDVNKKVALATIKNNLK